MEAMLTRTESIAIRKPQFESSPSVTAWSGYKTRIFVEKCAEYSSLVFAFSSLRIVVNPEVIASPVAAKTINPPRIKPLIASPFRNSLSKAKRTNPPLDFPLIPLLSKISAK